MHAVFRVSKLKSLKAIHNHTDTGSAGTLSCFQSVKVKKFESNSQHTFGFMWCPAGCFQSVKVKKFESNSQLYGCQSAIVCAVFRVSKLKSLKAIHNSKGYI